MYDTANMNYMITIPDFVLSYYFWYLLVAGGVFTFVTTIFGQMGFSKWYFENQLLTMGIITLASLLWPISIPAFYFGIIRMNRE